MISVISLDCSTQFFLIFHLLSLASYGNWTVAEYIFTTSLHLLALVLLLLPFFHFSHILTALVLHISVCEGGRRQPCWFHYVFSSADRHFFDSWDTHTLTHKHSQSTSPFESAYKLMCVCHSVSSPPSPFHSFSELKEFMLGNTK